MGKGAGCQLRGTLGGAGKQEWGWEGGGNQFRRAANTAIHPIKEKRAREATFDPLRQLIKVIIAHDKQTTN